MQAGKLLRITVSWAQFCVGTSTPILQYVGSKWPHFEAQWLKALRNYLRDIGGEICLSENYVPTMQRNKDKFLMDLVLSSKKLGPAAIKRINYCRLYQNVVLLSDISSPNGRHLDRAAYEGNFAGMKSTNPGHRVNQKKPNNKAWKEWRKFLHSLVNQDAELTLEEALEDWTVKPQSYSRHWKHLFST